MYPLTDTDREVLERLGFERSSVTGNWSRNWPGGYMRTLVWRDYKGAWRIRCWDENLTNAREATLGSPELVPSLVFAEIEGA